MSERFSREDVEKAVDLVTRVPETIIEAITNLDAGDAPILHLRNLNIQIAALEEIKECDCGAATCIAAPQHKDRLERFDLPVEALKTARDEFREKVIDWAYETQNCTCTACRASDMARSAPFN